MPKSAQNYSEQIRSQLKVLLPDLSVDPLTPERKIIDTVSEILAEGSIEPYLLNYQYDVDTKVGTDLDKFVALFGFARQSGRRSAGLVTFSRTSTAVEDIIIPTGTTVMKPATSVSSAVTFVTTAVGVLPAGATSVEIPIECADEGALGNVPAGTIVQISGSGLTSVSSVTNENATSGGSSTEPDADLRTRFKNTVFRNIAGTEDQFLALAIATRFSSKANVIGPQDRFIEYLQIEPDLSIQSIIPFSKYTYPFNYYLTNGDTTAEIFYTPLIDYTLTPSVPPVINITNTAKLPVGQVVLLEHTYCSINSRNDPATNILNYVDVFVSGQDAVTATETVAFPSSGQAFTTLGGSYDVSKFLRTSTNQQPVVGNRLQELLWQPVFNLPSVITINGVDYFQNTHYWQVRDTSVYKGSKRARDGIEWSSTVISQVPAGTNFTLSYDFNKLPLILNELMDRHKQIASDVLVHAAINRYFTINLIVMYTPGFNRSSVDTALNTALIAFLSNQQFGALLQISDLLEVAHSVVGVDNVRLALPGDGVPYGVQEVAADGVTILGAPYVNDFALQDSDLPIVNSVVTTQRSQNTW